MGVLARPFAVAGLNFPGGRVAGLSQKATGEDARFTIVAATVNGEP
jgi:hypothetical protein